MPLLYLSDLNNQAIASGVSVTASSEASGYPVTNRIAGKPWRSTGVAAEWIEFDKGAASAFTLAALVGHNLSSAATITVKAGASANPSTFSQVMTWREFTAFVLFASQSYRYIRIAFVDTTNAYGFLEVRKPILGAYVHSGMSPMFGMTDAPQFSTRRMETPYFVPSVEELAERAALTMQFRNLSSTTVTTLKSLIRTLKKDVNPLFVIPDSTVNNGYLMRFAEAPEYTPTTRNASGLLYNTSWSLVEDGLGNLVAL